MSKPHTIPRRKIKKAMKLADIERKAKQRGMTVAQYIVSQK